MNPGLPALPCQWLWPCLSACLPLFVRSVKWFKTLFCDARRHFLLPWKHSWKKLSMSNGCSKTHAFVCTMTPQISMCVSILESNSHFCQKQGLGIHKSRLRPCYAWSLCPCFLLCCLRCHVPPSLPPAPRVHLCPGWRGVVCLPPVPRELVSSKFI